MENNAIIESVPNFSEGRDAAVIEHIADAFRMAKGVALLDYSADPDHNRMVVTAAGNPACMRSALIEAIDRAVGRIDMNRHNGVHPRIGAVDVVPFIPICNMTMGEAVDFSRDFAREASNLFGLPIYLYERSALVSGRTRLEKIRECGFEGLRDKMSNPDWMPDYGSAEPHPTAGATVIGARMPLIAFNINLNTTDITIAMKIARSIRHSNGGIPYVKAIGVALPHKNRVQVSINLTDYTQTPLYLVYDRVRAEAEKFGVLPVESELIGLSPVAAMLQTAAWYLNLPAESASRMLEMKLWQSGMKDA